MLTRKSGTIIRYSIPSLSPSQTRLESHTLNSSLGTNSGGQTHGPGHEVGENLIGARRLAGRVFGEIGDLHGRAVLLGAAERAVEGGFDIGRNSPPLVVEGGDGAGGGGELLTGAGAQESGGSGGERHGG